LSTAEIADTLHMESSTRLSAPDTGPITVDQVGLGEYLSVHAGICAGLAVVGLAVPLAAVALVFLMTRSVCLSALSSRQRFLDPWLKHLAMRSK